MGPNEADARDAANHAVRDYLFACSQRRDLQAAVENGGDGRKLFFWNFDTPMPWVPPQQGAGGTMKRCGTTCTKQYNEKYGDCGKNFGMACHGGDISFVWQDQDELAMIYVTEENKRVAQVFAKFISNFVRNGDPNIDEGRVKNQYTDVINDVEIPLWQEFSMEHKGYMKFDENLPLGADYFSNPVITDRYGNFVLDHGDACDTPM